MHTKFKIFFYPKPNSNLLLWWIALVAVSAMLTLAASFRSQAAEQSDQIDFRGPILTANGKSPKRLAVFAQCMELPRIFGKIDKRFYIIRLPANTNCTVIIGEREWESLPLYVENAAITRPMPVLVYPKQVREPALAQELLDMGEEDQKFRGKNWQPGNSDLLARMQAGDNTRQQRLATIISTKGWPTISMVGWEASNAAWLIAQHSSPDRLKSWIVLMQKAALKHEIALYNLATSIDRVLVNDNKKQLYGTQYRMTDTGQGELYPIDDVDGLGQRRLRMGLPLALPAENL